LIEVSGNQTGQKPMVEAGEDDARAQDI